MADTEVDRAARAGAVGAGTRGGTLGPWPTDHLTDPGRAAEVLTAAMAGLPFTSSPDLVPLGPLALGSATLAELGRAARRLVALVERVCWDLTDDPRELARLTGMQARQVPLLGAGGAGEERFFAACNVRPDAVLVDGTATFLECNFGAANSGPTTTHVLREVYRSLHGPPPPVPAGWAEGVFEARAAYYRSVCDRRGLDHRVAVLGTLRETDVEDGRYFAVEPAYLRSVGIDSAFVEPEELAAGARPWSIVQKHFLPEEWLRLGVPLEPVRAAHRTSAFMVSDSGLSLSSKLVLAWLSAGTVPLSPGEREFVHRHVPWTREVVAGPVEYEGIEHDLGELARRSRERFVLKPANECGGRGVVVGRAVGARQWQAHLTEALAAGRHVLQEFVAADGAEATYWDRRSRRVRTLGVDHVLGPYVVDGTSAGCTVRHVPRSAGGVVNHARGAALNMVVPAGPAVPRRRAHP